MKLRVIGALDAKLVGGFRVLRVLESLSLGFRIWVFEFLGFGVLQCFTWRFGLVITQAELFLDPRINLCS